MRKSIHDLRTAVSLNKVTNYCTKELEPLNFRMFISSLEIQKRIALDAILIVDKLITKNERSVISIGHSTYSAISSIIMENILISYMEHLDVTKLKNRHSQKALILNIKWLKGILELTLPENCPALPEFTRDMKYLKKLEKFQLLTSCTDAIIKRLGENCPNMNYLNISFSKKVTNECLQNLLSLKKLTYLNISSTYISIDTYKIILNQLKSITNISWRENGIEEILTDIDEEILKHKDTFEGKIKAPKILVGRCPNIVSLTLETSEIIDLTPISEFGTLENVTLNGVNFALCNVVNIFGELGIFLSSVYLKSIEELNVSILVKYCMCLHSLTIENCKFSSDEINTVFAMPHFQNLTKLSLMSNTGDRWYINNVKYYKDLWTLNADSVEGFDDDFFKEAFENGAFTNLHEFTVRKGGRISIKTANLLIDSCPDLKVIGYLKEWTGLTPIDTEMIMEKIRENNYNLKVS
ncbi:hypothetical protein L9F63_016537 [Diploptera punctata]|uniref:Uncharacterized protein n=1 Tax=Diploptera punctata TaxID=6984 RepID=A0AAD8A0N7_DIPPU|nr:hypothetical protein L9F63_016537 [Diploptera punctata]